MDTIVGAYKTVFHDRADPRVSNWLLMTSPWPLVTIIMIYLVTIKLVLPAFMRDREPLQLRSVIKWYNILQIVLNAVVTWGIMTSGWTTTYHFGCMLPDYSMNPEALRMLRFLWWTIILKLLELLETMFFLLRKKDRQASFLHVYHHVSTLVIIWSAVKYVGDPRVSNWLLMTSPWPLVTIIMIYLVTIKLVLPAFMRDREPLQLRSVIKWYNILQIVLNAVVTWGIMTSGWTTTYHFGCMLPDYSMNPEALRMLRFLWWTIILKLLELLETMFFLLRKKDRQASFLHVYHHVSTLVIIWSAVKYVGGGITSFSPMINNTVHVIMYSYYLLSSEGSPTVKASLIKYKKWLTIMQMVQFTLMITYSVQVFFPSCPAPLGITILYFPNVIFVYYMFYKFFKQNYNRRNNLKINKFKK